MIIENVKKLYGYLLVSLLIILIFSLKNKAYFLDQFFLLEEKNPGYYYYLDKGNVYSIKEGFENTSNLLINNMVSRTINNLTIKINNDSSITLSGKYDGEDTSLGLCTLNDLNNGIYYLSDGTEEVPDNYHIYVEGWKYNDRGDVNKTVLASLPQNRVLYVDDKYDVYWVGIRIKSGKYFDDIRILPMLSKNEDLYYENMWMYGDFGKGYLRKFTVDIPKNVDLSESDWNIFDNKVRFQLNPICSSIVIRYLNESRQVKDVEEYYS